MDSKNAENFLIYKNDEGEIIVDAILKDETLWLTQKGMAKVFDVNVPAISKHLKNIFEDEELIKDAVVSKMEITADDGKNYNTEVYNLDAIIAVGYRINSKKATQFRIEEAYLFFKIVQNKLHYAISGHTAAELIYERANADKEHMGLTNWKNSPDGLIYKYDVSTAKNYLNEEELKKLNDLTNLFIVFAEDEAKERHIMTMKDWIDATDNLLKFRRKKVLNNAGAISHEQAVEKANKEYEKFKVKQDMEYISSMDKMYQRYLEESKKE